VASGIVIQEDKGRKGGDGAGRWGICTIRGNTRTLQYSVFMTGELGCFVGEGD